MKDHKPVFAALAFAVTMSAGASVHAQEPNNGANVNNLGSPAPIAAQAAGVYRDDNRDRRNALIALGAVAVAAAIAVGAFDSSDNHEPVVTPTPPPTHDG